ncbi:MULTISPECIES: low molecular weight phosphatase family protein [unclassified Mesorhizobium]|uniref:arsenate-mycothiol transferase ArsC n=1 Tax=unclassified Mesorhizobium TaxID=325217 RepID=UPI00112EC04D|nr:MULTISPECIES: low molecular weight phosphatase family protein [unclassified Mesorhizobium]TPN51384.1 low molecular weight phosphatase family protein [Mesorhizobium sp. B1-1-7]TPN56645.1 low molecular weight phosphatase family protein [Mesorhizobium sp. B1-1-9]
MAGLVLATLPRSILFLCGMNAVRSPMAEQLARRMLPATIFVASAGVRAGERDPFVDAVLAEDGLTLGERHPRTLDELEDDYFDLIVTLAPEAHHAALELTRSLAVEVEYWPTPDPTGAGGTREQIMASYRDVRERLKARIGRRFVAPDHPD